MTNPLANVIYILGERGKEITDLNHDKDGLILIQFKTEIDLKWFYKLCYGETELKPLIPKIPINPAPFWSWVNYYFVSPYSAKSGILEGIFERNRILIPQEDITVILSKLQAPQA